MKAVLFAAVGILVAATNPALAAQSDTRSVLVKALEKNLAVRGAVAEAKKWAGTKSCSKMDLYELNGVHFKARVTCERRGDDSKATDGADTSAAAGVEISGAFFDEPSAPMVESITLDYAG